jgi:hypothetical protein
MVSYPERTEVSVTRSATAVTTVAAHARSVPTGRQPARATQQNKPGKTSLSGLYARWIKINVALG